MATTTHTSAARTASTGSQPVLAMGVVARNTNPAPGTSAWRQQGEASMATPLNTCRACGDDFPGGGTLCTECQQYARPHVARPQFTAEDERRVMQLSPDDLRTWLRYYEVAR